MILQQEKPEDYVIATGITTTVREFIQKFPKSDHWIQIAKFYTQTEVNHGREKTALPILNQIYTA